MEDLSGEDLLIVWTSGDRDVALGMVFMYGGNAKRYGWWESVTLLVWGSSQKLLAEDAELQEALGGMLDVDVRAVACKACADNYGLSSQLEQLGVEVFYTGEYLTNWIKSDAHVVTF